MPAPLDRWYNRGKIEGEALGIIEGEARGEALGEARGKIKALAVTLLKFLNKRFGEVPASLEKRICSYGDPIVLESLFESALDCTSLEEFEKQF